MRVPTRLVVLLLGLGLPGAARAQDAGTRLHALFEEAWQFELRENPLRASAVGDRRYDDRLPSVAPADFERRAAFARGLLERLETIDREALSARDQVSHDMFRRGAQDELAALRFRTWRMPLNAEGSFHSGFARLPATLPFRETRDYEAFLARLRAFPGYARQQMANMREGLRTGFVHGTELVPATARLAIMNLLLHGVDADPCPVVSGVDRARPERLRVGRARAGEPEAPRLDRIRLPNRHARVVAGRPRKFIAGDGSMPAESHGSLSTHAFKSAEESLVRSKFLHGEA